MYRYESSAVAGLASQLKRGPSRLCIRQLCRIDFLMSVIDAGKTYPPDFVVHALTGYRAQRGSVPSRSADDDAACIPADVLRADLLVLAEELSAHADIPASAVPEPLMGVTELADRFRISTKTVFRWHRRGLIGWRLRFADRRVRLAFPEHCVRAFVASHAELVNRGAAFSQLSESERAVIVDGARDLVDAGSRSVNAVARVLADRTGRAVETIRLILKNHDSKHPRAGVFNRPKLRVAANDDRLQIWEAYVDGATVDSLAERFDRLRPEIYRILTEMRARDVKSRPIAYIASDEFTNSPDRAELLNGLHVRSPYSPVDAPDSPPAELPPYLQQLYHLPLLTPEGERALFRKMNYLRHVAETAREALDPTTATAVEIDEIERRLREADAVKNQIIQANLRLVVSIAKRHMSPTRDFFEIVSDGNVSLMRAVEKFDYSRGFKFSTYATWALMKNFARTLPEQRVQRDRYQTGREETLESMCTTMPACWDDDAAPALRRRIDDMLSVLDARERDILRLRFGLDSAHEPLTLEQIGREFGVSKERIRQLEARAMSKLRSGFQDRAAALLTA